MIRNVVVFPAPLGPSRPNTSPDWTVNDTLSTARTSAPTATVKQRVRFSTWIIAGPFPSQASTRSRLLSCPFDTSHPPAERIRLGLQINRRRTVLRSPLVPQSPASLLSVHHALKFGLQGHRTVEDLAIEHGFFELRERLLFLKLRRRAGIGGIDVFFTQRAGKIVNDVLVRVAAPLTQTLRLVWFGTEIRSFE